MKVPSARRVVLDATYDLRSFCLSRPSRIRSAGKHELHRRQPHGASLEQVMEVEPWLACGNRQSAFRIYEVNKLLGYRKDEDCRPKVAVEVLELADDHRDGFAH